MAPVIKGTVDSVREALATGKLEAVTPQGEVLTREDVLAEFDKLVAVQHQVAADRAQSIEDRHRDDN